MGNNREKALICNLVESIRGFAGSDYEETLINAGLTENEISKINDGTFCLSETKMPEGPTGPYYD